MYVHQRLPHSPEAPAIAREVIDAVLTGRLSGDAVSELRLVVSELVTNAVRHGSARRGAVDLLVTVGGGTARIEVTDGGDGFEAPGAEPAPAEPGGWGLIVVDRLASRWGVEGGRATRVWAEIPLETPGAGGGGTTEPVYAGNV